MDINIKVSYPDACKIADLVWGDILYAIENNFFDLSVAITHAYNVLKYDSSELEFELAALYKSDFDGNEVKNILRNLVKEEAEFTEDYYYHKWVYIISKQLYENRLLYSDPLKTIEDFYNNFGYPNEISDFIRYMPSDKSIPGNKEYNDTLLYKNWLDYLKINGKKYKSGSVS